MTKYSFRRFSRVLKTFLNLNIIKVFWLTNNQQRLRIQSKKIIQNNANRKVKNNKCILHRTYMTNFYSPYGIVLLHRITTVVWFKGQLGSLITGCRDITHQISRCNTVLIYAAVLFTIKRSTCSHNKSTAEPPSAPPLHRIQLVSNYWVNTERNRAIVPFGMRLQGYRGNITRSISNIKCRWLVIILRNPGKKKHASGVPVSLFAQNALYTFRFHKWDRIRHIRLAIYRQLYTQALRLVTSLNFVRK